MYKYVIGIDGMKCGMCESHVQDVIRKSIKVKKVKASHLKNNVIVISDLDLTLSFVAGCMIYVVAEEMIPEMTSEGHDHYGVWSFILGFVIMLVLDCIQF